LKFGHTTLSTYGIGKEYSRKQWFHLARQFIQKGLIVQDTKYGSLKLTEKAYDVLKGRELVFGILEEEHFPDRKEKRRSMSTNMTTFSLKS